METLAKPRKVRGLLTGILTGWVGVLIIDMLSYTFSSDAGGMNLVDFNFVFLLPAYVIIGLPIALTLGLIFGNIIWALFEMKGFTKMRHALLGGGIVGALLGGANFYLTLDLEYILYNLADLASTIAVGVVAGFVTHIVGYPKPGLEPSNAEAGA